MTGNEINLTQMLLRREKRFEEQKTMLEKFNSPLISFSMNIPGSIKTNSQILNAFTIGKEKIFAELQKLKAEINYVREVHEDTGDELILSIKNITPEVLKNMAVKIESENKIGRLFDIDVINSDGEKLSRGYFRKCLICEKQAQECARSRAHTVKEMQIAIDEILSEIPERKI